MQLSVNIRLEEPLSLPLNYNHIIQSVIYRSLSVMPDYASFLHEQGYTNRKRQYKMFHFGQLTGDYVVRGKKIIFQSYVMLEVRSPEPLLINILADNIWKNGITRCFVWRILTMCFTFTVQIMHHIPILMSYFGDYYARLLVS